MRHASPGLALSRGAPACLGEELRGSPGPCPADLCECVFTLPHLTVPPCIKQATEAWEDDSPLAAVYLETLRDIAAGEELLFDYGEMQPRSIRDAAH